MEDIGTETTSGLLLRFAEKRQTPTLSLVMGLAELSSTLFTGNRGELPTYFSDIFLSNPKMGRGKKIQR